MKYYIISGEASGDLHGSNLMKALKQSDKNATFRFWGGNAMKSVGGTLVKHYKSLSFMGFLEVLMNIRTILKNITFCKKDILQFQPNRLVFIDYPGFNLRIVEWAKKQGFCTHYYISPQVWAWKENRVRKIKRDVDYMYVILPFEKLFYENKHAYNVHFVGHPLLDVITDKTIDKSMFIKQNGLENKPIIALLPGSRTQEIKKILKIMVSVVSYFKDYQFVIACAPSQPMALYQIITKDYKDIKFVSNQTYELLKCTKAALVTSGTATLETALFGVPEVVCYKGSLLSYWIAKRVIKLKYISLVNLIMNKALVKELIQQKLTVKNLKNELASILEEDRRSQFEVEYKALRKKLGDAGASKRTAELIVNNN